MNADSADPACDQWLAYLRRRGHAGELQNHAGRGDRPPHRHHSHPIGQFPAHRLSQDWVYLLGGAGDAFALPFWAIPRPSENCASSDPSSREDADLFRDGRIVFCWETTSM